MGVSINCDDCGGDIAEETICRGCIELKDEEIAQFKKEVDDLGEEIAGLKETIEDYEREKGE